MCSTPLSQRGVTLRQQGFTLIELMVVVAIIGILAGIAMPLYSQYVFRSRVPAGLDSLSAFQLRMEQRYQDSGNYGTLACAIPDPAALNNFSVTCALSAAGQGFLATATGSGPVAGVQYSIDHNGTRRTVAHPAGLPPTECWSIKGLTCDS